MYAKSLQSCLTLCNPMDCSPLGSSVHGILQARILEWTAMPSPRGSSLPRDWTRLSSVQFSHSVVSDSLWPHEARQASLSITNSRSLPKLMSIESMMPSNHLILCCPPSPPAFNVSQHQGLFKWVSSSHQVAKMLEFQLQHESFQWTPRTDFL